MNLFGPTLLFVYFISLLLIDLNLGTQLNPLLLNSQPDRFNYRTRILSIFQQLLEHNTTLLGLVVKFRGGKT